MQNSLSQTLCPPIPYVIWRRIVDYLSDDLSTLLLLSALSPELQDICRPHTSSFFHTIRRPPPPIPAANYYHSLVRLVLEGHLDPSAIFEFFYPDQPFGGRKVYDQQVYSSDHFFREAVRASPFIPTDLESEVCMRFRHGDPDAALVVLLPLCTRLKMLEGPGHSELCAAMFQTIAQEHRRRGTNAGLARRKAFEAALRDRGKPWRRRVSENLSHTLPFSELLVLYVSDSVQDDSFSLIEMVPYMMIPSLYRIILTAPRDQTFPGWPAGDTCSCPQIYFQQAMVNREAVLAFAQGVTGPCEIRQWYERNAHFCGSGPDEPTWDRVLIERRPDGSKTIETRLVNRDRIAGYNYPWISWLLHGKMQDWTRLDEEFSLEEGDHEVDWLGSCLT